MSLTNPDRLFLSNRAFVTWRELSMKASGTFPSSARTAIASHAGLPGNKRFPNPAELLVVPDHYLLRMLGKPRCH
ncbi:MAG: hypothetical protein CM15mP60_1260 [Alphaproteobacteria bacterium]|nr:MAG: hypothetical protein CM15mP60_1260 [Alphaproteobacteria bacterium]